MENETKSIMKTRTVIIIIVFAFLAIIVGVCLRSDANGKIKEQEEKIEMIDTKLEVNDKKFDSIAADLISKGDKTVDKAIIKNKKIHEKSFVPDTTRSFKHSYLTRK